MDENPHSNERFESLLQHQSTRRPAGIYSDVNKYTNSRYTAKDVITNVAKTMRAIQNADFVRPDRNVRIKLAEYKKAQFLSVSQLPVSKEELKPPAPSTSAFETPSVSDMQLINIIDKAEGIDVGRGMTQEFETAFCFPQDEADVGGEAKISKENETIRENMAEAEAFCDIKELTMSETLHIENTDIDRICNSIKQNISNSEEILHNIEQIQNQATLLTKHESKILNESIDIELSLDNLGVVIVEEPERPESPVLKTNAQTKKSLLSQHLVVDLEKFENFERLVTPLLNSEDIDPNTIKQLINSQILDKELRLQPDFDVQILEEQQCSPILETKHTEKQYPDIIESGNLLEEEFEPSQILINKTNKAPVVAKDTFIFTKREKLIKTNENPNKPIQRDKVVTNESEDCLKIEGHFETIQRSVTPLLRPFSVASEENFKDEILFSSDEEEDYVHKSIQELPFTCALETSFYTNQSDVLDKTMYVGFQTASNKSIQVSIDSYDKAQNVLEQFSLKDMVEKCSGSIQNERNAENTYVNEAELTNVEEKKMMDTNIGFKIASGENIAISKEAMMESNAIFKDLHSELTEILRNDADVQVIANIPEREKDRGDTLAKVKNIFKDIDLHDIFDNEMKAIENEEDKKMHIKSSSQEKDSNFTTDHFEGFKTASNKSIKISKIALERSRKLLQDIDKLDELNVTEVTNATNDQVKANSSTTINCGVLEVINTVDQAFKGFTTASNKKIQISEKALAQTKNLFQDIDFAEEFDEEIALLDDFKVVCNENIKEAVQKLGATEKENQVNNECRHTVQNLAFEGFRTASDKYIKISKQALARSKRVFQNIDSETTREMNDMTDHPHKEDPNIETARDKHLIIPEESLAKDHNVFQNIDNIDQKNTEQNICQDADAKVLIDSDVEKETQPIFMGFQTASKKPVVISKEVMEKTTKMFEDIESTKTISETEPSEKDTELKFIGFQTASKKPLTISKEALEKTKSMFRNIDDVEMPTKQEQNKEPKFVGFQTASKKPVNISKEALEKTKSIFDNIDDVTLPKKQNTEPKFVGFETSSEKPVAISKEALGIENIDEISNIEHKPESKFVGFQTASKKPVLISKEAMEKTRHLFQDIDKDEEIPQFQGFTTASNKKVEISEKAIGKRKKLFEDIVELKGDETAKETLFQGFQTASKKTVTIKPESLTKAKTLFDNFNPTADVVLERATSRNVCGFQTASNKAVKISAEALARTKGIFQDIDMDEGVDKFEGFKAVSKKTVDINEEALAKTKNIFQEIEKSEDDIPAKKAKFLGFQTASKKKVQISDEALAKTREIFKDFPMSQSVDTKIPESQILCFKNAKNNDIPSQALAQSRSVLANTTDVKRVKTNLEHNIRKHDSEVEEIELDKIINTQVLNNFEETLNTEDFCPETPKINRKRSASPILSCPKAKKRTCFKTPYKIAPKKEPPTNKITKVEVKPKDTLKLDENYKKVKYYTLKIIQQLENDSKEITTIDPYIHTLKFEDLLQFKFSGERNNLNSKHTLSVQDLKSHFVESVDKKILPHGWFENHVKLIIWKLISYEIRFPKTLSYTCNAKTVIDQLKYRYDRELYKVERPALRKILEKDDVSTRTIVLCVVGIFADGENVTSVTNPAASIELLLSDGWYCVKACTDKMLSKLVFDGRIVVGCKLATHGAELANCDQGIAPWEDTSKVRLKLSGNSTRRARWDARLGYHGDGAILCPLSAVTVDGGKVSKTRLLVTRVYPLLYVDKLQDGSTVTRSERLEQIYQMKYEADRQIQLEKLYEEIEKEFSDQESQDSEPEPSSGKRRCMESGSQIAKMMKRSKDPAEFRSTLTESQHLLLVDHSARSRARLLEAIQARVQHKLARSGLDQKRNVVTLLKVRVAACGPKGLEVTKGLLSIWRPHDAILDLLQEGSWVDVMDVVPTALRYSEIQLSAGRQSTFDKAKVKETDKLRAFTKSLSRTCYSIKYLTQNPNSKTEYNEIDTVGIVFAIEPSKADFEKESVKNQHLFQNVYLTDAEKNFMCINFWGGIRKFGFENLLDTGQIIVGTNLQKRAGNTRKNIPHYRATEFTCFTKTPKNVKAREMVDEMVKKIHGIDRRKFCQECCESKNTLTSGKYKNNVENFSPYRFDKSDYNLSKNKIYIESPLLHKPVQRKDIEDLNLTGLDFESTFKQRETQDFSPEELKRKQRVREKMAKLKMYGEPPPISPIHIINKSKNACNGYRSPLTSNLPQEIPKTTSNINYQNGVGVAKFANEKPPNSVEITSKSNFTDITSPVVSMNRTYVKNVNPVKLNFSNSVATEENSITVEHFAGEFDDSPPLSLD